MSRLFGAEYDEKQWKVELISDDNYRTYKLIDKKEMETYYFHNIIGFEQIKSNEFLVLERAGSSINKIVRYRLYESELYNIFEQQFNSFEFINEDRIAFAFWDNRSAYRLVGIYSISENKEIEDANWLRGMGFSTPDDKIIMEDKMYDSILGDNKIVFSINPDTLEIDSDVYSSFRDGYTKINSKDEYKEFRSQEQKYMNYVSNYYFNQKNDAIENATKRILKKENN